jgi:hypothetical protein
MVRPLTVVPYLGPLLAMVIDPPLRLLVETGYNRTINPGAPTPAKYLYIPNPFDVAINTLQAIPTGWDNGIAYVTGDPANRPFHTAPQGPYGVGGPPVDAGTIDPYGPPTPVAPPAPGATPAQAAPPAQAAVSPDSEERTLTAATPRPRSAAAAKDAVERDHSAAHSRSESHRSGPNRPAGRARAAA